MWVGAWSPSSGDGQFVFVPNPNDPLKMSRIDQDGNVVGEPIQPGMMYTDGGSIPRIATVFKGFSPWGYAPAYMIHDWLFIAKHCVTDGMASYGDFPIVISEIGGLTSDANTAAMIADPRSKPPDFEHMLCGLAPGKVICMAEYKGRHTT
jgi:hypothetical protein